MMRLEHGGVGVLAHGDGQAAKVVEVAVCDDDKIDVLIGNFGEIGRGLAADQFGVEAGVNEDVYAPNLYEHRVGADAALAVQIDKFHQ
jgi:hypothetical protein